MMRSVSQMGGASDDIRERHHGSRLAFGREVDLGLQRVPETGDTRCASDVDDLIAVDDPVRSATVGIEGRQLHGTLEPFEGKGADALGCDGAVELVTREADANRRAVIGEASLRNSRARALNCAGAS